MNQPQSNGIKQDWNYTKMARHYSSRPNYAEAAIKKLCEYVGAKVDPGYSVADIGAGTGNLSILLADKVGRITAVEPNDAMREIGIQTTAEKKNITWVIGTGENTTLESGQYDLVAFGSSFNTTDRPSALKESFRLLKPEGYFSCMWNNRDLTIQSQKKVESLIRNHVPDYSHGTRRQQQADVIMDSRLFNHLYYFEESQDVRVDLDQYVDAWKSVKNQHWDLETAQGQEVFDNIVRDIRMEFGDKGYFDLVYVTKVWVARKETI